jgi:hypothetical protein
METQDYIQGGQSNYSPDPLIQYNNGTSNSSERTNKLAEQNRNEELIQMMSCLGPESMSDEDFVQATISLNGKDFARLVYLTYLKRELEIMDMWIPESILLRTAFIKTIKSSLEYEGLWSARLCSKTPLPILNPLYDRAAQLLLNKLINWNQNKWSDRLFVQLTYFLDSLDFGRAAYRTYLKREPDYAAGVKRDISKRLSFIYRLKNSEEYIALHSLDIQK